MAEKIGAAAGSAATKSADSMQSFRDFLKDMSRKRSGAEKGKSGAKQDETVDLISFVIGDETYGIELKRLQEILKVTYIAKVPKTPDFMLGVINLRGNIVASVDLKRKFNMGRIEVSKLSRIMVVQSGRRHVGFVVDRVVDVVNLPTSRIEPPPPVVGGIGREFLKGVGKIGSRIIILPDIDKILASL